MKRLWKMIPPCYSDVLGFEAVLNETNGFGIVDDPSRYKPLKMDGGRPPHHLQDGGFHGGPDRRGGPGSHGGPGRHGFPDIHVINSDIRNADIIQGTQQKVLETFDCSVAPRHPDFVLLSYAPSSSMIGSDLDTAANLIAEKSGLPAACVNLHGDKDYLYGVSLTLETIGKLLLTKQAMIPGTVNLLGCNSLDWSKETLAAAENRLADAGYVILSRWGAKETTENLRKASAASVNLVVNAAGFRLARYMEAEFGIPYLAGAPFGTDQTTALLEALDRISPIAKSAGSDLPADEIAACEAADHEITDRQAADHGTCGCSEPEVLVIGEQLTADAVRQALLHRGFHNIQIFSFYDMEKSYMQPGDQKLNSEDDLIQKIRQSSVRLAIGDPDCKALAPRDIPWIDLPNGANFSPVNPVPNFNMAGEALDHWLDNALQNRSIL